MKPARHPAAAVPRVFRALLLADTHFGSQFALVPPAFRPVNGGPTGPLLAHLWKCWEHFIEALPPVDVAFHVGDVLEGEHPTMRSAPDALTTNPVTQGDMAIEALRPLVAKVGHWWQLRGTGFHDGKWAEQVERVAATIGAEPWADGSHAGDVLTGTFGGLTWNLSHAQSTGAIYPGTLQNRTAWFAALSERLAKTEPADVIVRAHTHATAKGFYHGKWVVSCRAWKAVNPYAVARMEFFRAAALCDLGAHLVTITDEGICWKDYDYQPFKAARLRKLA